MWGHSYSFYGFLGLFSLLTVLTACTDLPDTPLEFTCAQDSDCSITLIPAMECCATCDIQAINENATAQRIRWRSVACNNVSCENEDFCPQKIAALEAFCNQGACDTREHQQEPEKPEEQEPLTPQDPTSLTVPRVELQVTIDKSAYERSEPVHIVITNPSDEKITLHGCDPPVSLMTDASRSTADPLFCGSCRTTLKPHSTQTFDWNMGNLDESCIMEQTPAGKYRVRVLGESKEGGFFSSSKRTWFATSDAFEILMTDEEMQRASVSCTRDRDCELFVVPDAPCCQLDSMMAVNVSWAKKWREEHDYSCWDNCSEKDLLRQLETTAYAGVTCEENVCKTVKLELPKLQCQNESFGWQCKFNDVPRAHDMPSESASMLTEYLSAKLKSIEEQCSEEGGRLKCYGFCMPHYTRYCEFPHSDAGEECTSSDQCEGLCTIDMKEARELPGEWESCNDIWDDSCDFTPRKKCPDCVGTCSEYPLRGCDWWFQFENGIIEDHAGIICD